MEIQNRAFTARVKPGALKMALEFHRFTYRKLEQLSGVSKSTIGNLANGRATTCNPETAAKIAEAFGVSTNNLFMLEPIHYADEMNKVAA
ncbi:helix-turn-helix domain-containing protein [Rothia amarae]|uniref:helix-turn-helix domain-containing protein n=1 Tax=Rothia amarae TaxID=169480 RepID=UPI0011A09797